MATLSEILDGIKDLIKPYSDNPNELVDATFSFATDEYVGYEKNGVMYKLKSVALVNKILTLLSAAEQEDPFYPAPINGAIMVTGDELRYYKDTVGAVHLTGAVRNTDGSQACIAVADGYTPDRDITFNLVSSSNNTINHGTIDSDGKIYITVPDGDTAHVNLIYRAGE